MEEPQLFVVSEAVAIVVVVVGLVEECMVCLGQQHFGRKEHVVVVVAEGWTI